MELASRKTILARGPPTASTGRTYGCKRSDQTRKKLLWHGGRPHMARGPSTYGSRLKAGTTEGLCLTPQPRSAIEPGEIAIIIFRRLRVHDRITEAGVLSCGMIDVLADGAG